MTDGKEAPGEAQALHAGVGKALDTDYGDGRRIGDSRCGVYLFMTTTGSRSTWAARPRACGPGSDGT